MKDKAQSGSSPATDRSGSERALYRRAGTELFRLVDKALPHAPAFDAFIHTLRFWRANGRLPRRSADPRATFNDFVLERILADRWSPMERACIDKQQAKQAARRLCPEVKVSETVAILPAASADDARRAADVLAQHIGREEVAKPTHSSGSVLFLRLGPTPDAISDFCSRAAGSYYHASRESQYRGLPRKIIVEQDLSCGPAAPTDYKFFCSLGEVLFCQVDVDRFTDHRRRLVTPDFQPIDARFAYDLPEATPGKPGNFAAMIEMAEALSRPFPFVRVDLYSIGDAVYFGEFTFAPEGGAGALSNEDFGIAVMTSIRRRLTLQETGS